MAGCGGSISESALTTAGPATPSAGPAATAPLRPRGPEAQRLIGAYGGVYRKAPVEAAVEAIVAKLVRVSDLSGKTVSVTILNSPAVNAFALPSGEIFVTRGLLALANDESELAAVIAHEIAHVVADHAGQRARQARAAALARRVSEMVADESIARASRDTADVSVATFSQAQELEADRLGIEILARAGYDPFAAVRFLEAMKAYAALPALNAASARGTSFLSSHPSTPERIAAARRTARSFAAPGTVPSNRVAYLRALEGLLYGDHPREGFVRGREFAHVDLAIAFTVPEGFVLKNTSAAVLATDGAHTAIRFDAAEVAPETSLADYLRSGWIEGLVEASVRTEPAGTLEAATASALVEGWSFRIAVVRGPNRVFRFIFASSRPVATYEEAFRRTLSSFRLLSPSERAAMRPLRVRIVRAGRADTFASLASRMVGVGPAARLPLLRVLNGSPDAALREGDLVKIVSE